VLILKHNQHLFTNFNSPAKATVCVFIYFSKKKELIQQHSNLAAKQSLFLIPVPWLDDRLHFYALNGFFSLSTSTCFRNGRIYGMDVSSGAAVAALLWDVCDTKQNERNKTDTPQITSIDYTESQQQKHPTTTKRDTIRVLDLCCSPGLKLCTIADMFTSSFSSNATVVGVDISTHRMALCKNIVKKYHIDPSTSGHAAAVTGGEITSSKKVDIRLYETDGTAFGRTTNRAESWEDQGLIFDSTVAHEQIATAGKRKRMNKSAKSRERKRLKERSFLDYSACLPQNKESLNASTVDENALLTMKQFDKVLVDAECSTDGAIKHLQKKQSCNYKSSNLPNKMQEEALTTENSSPKTQTMIENTILSSQPKLTNLVKLQQSLLLNGFHLLKPGGTLIYSTCSLCSEQNEGVISWLLHQEGDAFVTPVSFTKATSLLLGEKRASKDLITEGSICGTVRFCPSLELSLSVATEETNAVSSDIGSIKKEALFGGGFFLAKIGKKCKK